MSKQDFQQFTAPFSHRICEKLEIADDLCSQCGYIEIISNYCALIDGCKGVMEYTDDTVKLSLGKKTVTFCGDNLTIRSLSMEQAMVEGFIVTVEFGN